MSRFEPEKNNDYAPNAVQQEFIRLCAEKYWYLALGDTDHGQPEIRAFALNSATVDALERGGKRQYFLELTPQAQYYCDYERQKNDEKGQSVTVFKIYDFLDGRRAFGGLWLDKEDSDRLGRIFEKASAEHLDMRFIAADQRLANGEDGEMAGNLKRINRARKAEMTWKGILQTFRRATGLQGGWMDRIAESLLEKYIGSAMPLLDDQKTADMIRSSEKPAAILFGAGHFTASSAKVPNALGSLLPGEVTPLCVLDILADEMSAASDESDTGENMMFGKADAELFVFANEANRHGIRINNPDLLPLYEQAVKNVQAGLTPHEMTRQFLPS